MHSKWVAFVVSATSCAAFGVGPAPALRRGAPDVVHGSVPRHALTEPRAHAHARQSSRLAMHIDPAQATDAFMALGAAAATASVATAKTAAAAYAVGGAAKATAAGATAAQSAGLSFDSLLEQVQSIQALVFALPAVVLKDPAVKSALASVQAVASSLQGAEVKAVKSIENLPAIKQLQAELNVLAKVLAPYEQAAAAKLNVEALMKQLPAPLQIVEKELEKMGKLVVQAITIISRDSDKDLFNGYPFNPQALLLWFTSLVAYSSVAFKDDAIPVNICRKYI